MIVWEQIEFGHHFVVYRLDKPGPKGRMYHLWDNGQPATGGQWHYSIQNAQERAKYLLHCSYVGHIRYLEERVQVLESEAAT